MATVFFGSGEKLQTSGSAKALIQSLGLVATGKERASEHGQPLPMGYVALDTEHGPVYVNAAQVAFVRD
jgi:hypothetical protein